MDDYRPGPSAEVLGKAVEENAVSLWRSWSADRGITFSEEADRAFVISGIPHPAFNHLFRLRFAETDAELLLERALAPFKERGVPCFCWIDPAAALPVRPILVSAGLEYSFTAPGMAIALEDLDRGSGPPFRLGVEEVLDDEGLRLWSGVISAAASFSADASSAWLTLHRCIPFGPGRARRHFLARLGGEVVGTSSLLFAAGGAGLYSVTVKPEHRRQGVGTALSRATLAAAGDAGRQFATLVSTALGAGIYRRLGFREYRRWEGWTWAP